MALNPMPIRDPERSEREPQHAREYDPDTGGWTRPVSDARAADDMAAARTAARR